MSPRGLAFPALRSPLAAALCVAAIVSLLGIWNHELWSPDEPRDAAIGREMWQTGSWAVPRLSGEPFLEKPPLFWWVEATLFAAAGRADAGLARLPSVLFSLGTLLFAVGLARRFRSPEAPALLVLILLTTSAFAHQAHNVIVDTALAFGMMGAAACFAHSELAANRRSLAGMAFFLALAFLAKGTLGLGLPLVAAVAELALLGLLRRRLGALVVCGAAASLVGAAWLAAVYQEVGTPGVRTFLVANQLARFLPEALKHTGGHSRPFYYYGIEAPMQFLPWTPLLLMAVCSAWRQRAELDPQTRAVLRGAGCFLATTLLVLSLAGTKRALYVLPLMPFGALFIAWWLSCELPQPRWEVALEQLWRRLLVGAAVVIPCLPLVADRSAWPWLGASALLAVLALQLERDRSATRALRWRRSALLVTAAWACLLVSGPPLMDRQLNLVAHAHELVQAVPAEQTFWAVAPSETLSGIVQFYTDRRLRVLRDVGELYALARRPGPHWVLFETPLDKFQKGILPIKGISFCITQRIDRPPERAGGISEDGVYVLRVPGFPETEPAALPGAEPWCPHSARPAQALQGEVSPA